MLLLSQESYFWMEAGALLGRALALEWVSRVIFLEAAICVGGRQPFGVCGGGGAISASAYKQGIGVAFKQLVIILHVSFRAMSTCPVCLERPHEEQALIQLSKNKALMRLFVR